MVSVGTKVMAVSVFLVFAVVAAPLASAGNTFGHYSADITATMVGSYRWCPAVNPLDQICLAEMTGTLLVAAKLHVEYEWSCSSNTPSRWLTAHVANLDFSQVDDPNTGDAAIPRFMGGANTPHTYGSGPAGYLEWLNENAQVSFMGISYFAHIVITFPVGPHNGRDVSSGDQVSLFAEELRKEQYRVDFEFSTSSLQDSTIISNAVERECPGSVDLGILDLPTCMDDFLAEAKDEWVGDPSCQI